jgi:1,4-alpha-glucan branching enzyme
VISAGWPTVPVRGTSPTSTAGENLEATGLLHEFNVAVHAQFPGVLTIAEESTAWPGATRPVDVGGLGFTHMWNMGWMHDTLQYFAKDALFRSYEHDKLTFGLIYAWSENFIPPLSHGEVVHGKGSLLGKMPGDSWQKPANLRALYGWMWAHPGEKVLFTESELGQELEGPTTGPSIGTCCRTPTTAACAANLTPVPRRGYRIGLPGPGPWREVLNTDDVRWAGTGCGQRADRGRGSGLARLQALRHSHAAPARRDLALELPVS